MKKEQTPLIAITMGDPGGIGPEITLKAATDPGITRLCRPLIIGDHSVLRACLPFLSKNSNVSNNSNASSGSNASTSSNNSNASIGVNGSKNSNNSNASTGANGSKNSNRSNDSTGANGSKNSNRSNDSNGSNGSNAISGIPVHNPCRPLRNHRWGAIRKAYGSAAMEYVRFAVSEALAGRADGIVTAPICKEAIHRAGYRFQGHTDYLAHLTDAKQHAMMLMGRGLRVVLVTVHVSIGEVSALLTKRGIMRAITLAHDACRLLGLKKRRIGVCALNPHAGEHGAFGREEIEIISPAIRAARRRGIDVKGPFPADTLFVEQNRKEFEIIVAMYHDQGLIPLKMRAFDVGVNITLGLPITRTSPDHGAAFDIAGRGIADPRSMIEAIKVACRMASRRPER